MAVAVCPHCGFDAERFEPRPEKVAGALRWHLAVCAAAHDSPDMD